MSVFLTFPRELISYPIVFVENIIKEWILHNYPSLSIILAGRAKNMTRDRSIDLFILALNVLAIVVLVGILSVMVNTSDAKQLAGQYEQSATTTPATHE